MGKPSARRALFALLLLTLGALAQAPAAQAQSSSPLLCFDREDCSRPNLNLPPPDYMEGETVRITAADVETSYVRVACVDGCRDAGGLSFYARWTGSPVAFPQDFGDPGPGPDFDGANPRSIRAPRYNSTWEAAALLPAGQEAKRLFHVWVLDVFRGHNATVEPGAWHTIRASGFDPNAPVDFRLERRLPSGTFVGVPLFPRDALPAAQPVAPPGSANGQGVYEFTWYVPKNESQRIADCGERRDDCYRVRLSGPGKQNETVAFRVAPALVQARNVQAPPEGEAVEVERTSVQTIRLAITYPRGAAGEGPKLQMRDLTTSAGLKVVVERYNESEPEKATYVNETRMVYAADRFVWEASWTIPRDLPLDNGSLPEPSATYRLRLAEARDVYGNVVPSRVLGNYTVTRAEIAPALVAPVARLGRTEEGAWAYAVRYHNGSVLGPAEAATRLTGCFLLEEDRGPAGCGGFGVEHAEARFGNETWTFSKRYPRAYADVGEDHRLLVNQSLADHWGNRVLAAEPPAFKVEPGSPRIAFATVQAGSPAEILVRGSAVAVTAEITYADGAALNSTHLGAAKLNVTLTKRGPLGGIQSEGPLELRETDPRAGRWTGSFMLGGDATSAPAGNWTFTFDVKDNLTAPNANLTSFHREVAASLIRMEPREQPSASIATGSPARFRFRLAHANGTYVDPATIGADLGVRVQRYDKATGALVGEPVSGLVPPVYSDARGDWSVEYVVPPHLFDGSYAYAVRGVDAHGNRIESGARSREFATFSEVRERSVLVQPPPGVKRGDSATAIFDGREGDMGSPAVGVPAVRLERFDEASLEWVVERQTLRVSDPTTDDHVAVFEVGTNTVIGAYRFRLEGRDASYGRIHAVSQNFTVEPTLVARTLIDLPPGRAQKGELIGFSFERIDGDRITFSEILLENDAMPLQRPSLTIERDRINASLQVPFDAPSGKYSVHVAGRDLYGNVIDLYTPFVEIEPARLTGRILGQPARFVERGETAKLLFGVANPDGSFYLQATPPRVFVRNATSLVAQAVVAREGAAFTASWTPPETAEETEYVFEVSGESPGGNAFPTLRGEPFRVVPGELTRGGASQPAVENLRMTTITYAVAFKPDDDAVGFELGYFGPSTDLAAAVFETREPVSRTPIPHTVDVATGRYVARFVTDQVTPTGAYRIYMNGTDAAGNALLSKSNVFTVRATTVLLNFDAFPPQSEFGEGKTLTISFVARYRSGEVMTDEQGAPSAVVLLNRQPVKQRPEIEFRDGRWFMSWTAPDILTDGGYVFSVGGADFAGNGIASQETTLYTFQSDLGESFGKAVPGPGVGGLVALVALVGALLGRLGRR